MTKKQIELAARLYELANTACLDLGGCATEEEEAVVERAVERSRARLERLGYDPSGLTSLQLCMSAARRDA